MRQQTAIKFITALIGALLVCGFAAGAVAASAVDSAVIKLIPADVDAALVIPNLKTFSDETTQCLEGMDRAQFLLGSRPLDQLKSITGFNVGVDDLGGLAIVVFHRDNSWQIAALVPVTDAKAFLAGNFTQSDGDQYTRPDGLRITARDLGSHVLMSQDPPTAQGFSPPADEAGSLFSRVMADASLINTGEAFLWTSHGVLQEVSDQVVESTKEFNGGNAKPPTTPSSALMVLDVDALAVILRSMTRYAVVENPDGGLAEQASPSIALASLPSKPFYWAGGANVGALRDAFMLMGRDVTQILPAWLRDSQTIHMAAYPSPAGLAGGLLNDSALIIRSNDSAAVRAGIKSLVTESTEIAAFKRESKWEDAREVKDVGVAAAFEIRTADVPPDYAQIQMFEQFIFGRNGIRGFVATKDDAVVMTFSQRPAVLGAALKAVSDRESSLESSPMLGTMRQWMPAHRDVEGYLGVAQLVEMAGQIVQSFGLPADTVPTIDPAAPPVGLAVDVGPASLESSLVLPAPVMAMFLDEAMRQFAARMKTPSTQPEGDSNASGDGQ